MTTVSYKYGHINPNLELTSTGSSKTFFPVSALNFDFKVVVVVFAVVVVVVVVVVAIVVVAVVVVGSF